MSIVERRPVWVVRRARLLPAAAGLGLALHLLVVASGGAPGPPPAAAPLGAADRQFLLQAGNMGTSQPALAGLAARKAADPRVRRYAQRLIADHARIEQHLRAGARATGATLPSRLDRPAARERSRLSRLSGRAFDHEFLRFETLDFRFHVEQFTREVAHERNFALKRFAREALPAIEQHLRTAVSLAAAR